MLTGKQLGLIVQGAGVVAIGIVVVRIISTHPYLAVLAGIGVLAIVVGNYIKRLI